MSCEQRGICPTCHQRRTLDTAETIASEICATVPHRHWVFAIPNQRIALSEISNLRFAIKRSVAGASRVALGSCSTSPTIDSMIARVVHEF